MPLPLVLAGPILRRADPGRVCIWLATSEKISVRGEVFADPNGNGSQSQDPMGLAILIAAGARLLFVLGITSSFICLRSNHRRTANSPVTLCSVTTSR